LLGERAWGPQPAEGPGKPSFDPGGLGRLGRTQPGKQQAQPMAALAPLGRGWAQQTDCEVEALGRALVLTRKRTIERLAQNHEAIEELATLGRHLFGCSRRRGRAAIGDKIREK
jgi:hypothetical protein